MTINKEKGGIELAEKVSSFIDGELDRQHCEELISSLCKDTDLKSCLERYQMIGDTMRSHLLPGFKRDFTQCVMSAIDSEPTVFAPSAIPSHKSVFATNMSKKVAGFAIAASVATLAVIGVQLQNKDESQQIASMPNSNEFVRLPQENPVTAQIQPVIVPRSSSGYSNASTAISQQSFPKVTTVRTFDPKLHQYIVNHSQFVSGSGVHDIISHARIVASTQQKNNVDQVQR